MSLSEWAPDAGRAVADIAVRALKTAITTFVGIVGTNVAGWTDLDALQAAGIAAAGAAGSVVLNAILNWANKR